MIRLLIILLAAGFGDTRNPSNASLPIWFYLIIMYSGVVTTARVTHATPGATYAHVAHRNWEADSYQDESQKKCDDIAKQLVYSDAGNKINVSSYSQSSIILFPQSYRLCVI